MSLNCKPGDLARVIDDPEARVAGIVDKIITVTQPELLGGLHPAWRYAGPPMVCVCGCGRQIEAVADTLLRPIRGQDGDDETLAWAGKPATHDAPVTA